MKIRDCITQTTTKNEDGIFPISFTTFVISCAAILTQCADQLIAMDFPTATAEGSYLGGGEGRYNAGVYDYVRVFTGADMLRHTSLFLQVSGFLCWLLEQEVNDCDDETVWFEYDFLGQKWNEYARIQQQEDKCDGGTRWKG